MSPYGENRRFAVCKKCGHHVHSSDKCWCGCGRAGAARPGVSTPGGCPAIHLRPHLDLARSATPLPPTPGLDGLLEGRKNLTNQRLKRSASPERPAQTQIPPKKASATPQSRDATSRRGESGQHAKSRKAAEVIQTPQTRLIKVARSRFTSLDALTFLKKVSRRHRVPLRMDSGLDIWAPLERLVIESLSDHDAVRYADVIEERHRQGMAVVDLT
jgi:hypothetical protein